MSKFSDIMERAWTEVLEFLEEAFNWVKPIFGAALQQLVKGGGATLIAAAENAVLASSQMAGASNEEKWKAAKGAIVQTMEDSGQQALDSAINLAIEMAVAKMKASLAE